MEKTISFTDETRDQIIAEQEALGFRLYEEQMHFDGWWLLFTDEPYVEPEPVMDLATKVSELEARTEILERR